MRDDLRDLMLESMPASIKDMTKATGYAYQQARKLVLELKADGLCYVLRWKGATAIYAAGQRKDAPIPEPLGQQEHNRKWRHKKVKKLKAVALVRSKGPFAALFQK